MISPEGITSVEETSQEPSTSEATERSEVKIEVVLLDSMEELQENSKGAENLSEEEGGYLVISESEDIYLDTDVGSGDVETEEEHKKELLEDGLNSEAMKLRSGSGEENEDEETKDGEGMVKEVSDRDIVKKEPVIVVIKEKEVAPKEMKANMNTPNLGPFGSQFIPIIKTPFPPSTSSSLSLSSTSSPSSLISSLTSSSSSSSSSSSFPASSSLHQLLCGVVLVCLAIN